MQNITELKCDYCSAIFAEPLSEAYTSDYKKIKICIGCKTRGDFFTCDDCLDIVHEDQYTDIGGEAICRNCRSDHYTDCYDCSEIIHNDNSCYCESCDREYCSRCYDSNHSGCGDDNRSPNTRRYSTTSRLYLSDMPDPLGTIQSNRIFSAEIECYYPDVETHNDTLEGLPTALGCSTDGSLNSNGIEFQTPLLSGGKGEKGLIRLLTALNKSNYRVDTACGLHIHLDGKGYKDNLRAIKNLIIFYILFEDVLLSYLPRSRRNNQYCRLLKKDYHIQEIKNAGTLADLEKLWYRTENINDIASQKRDNKSSSTRYYGINFHCLLAEGHIEIRYHSGTINAKKILEWINLHTKILDSVLSTPIGDGLIAEILAETDIKAKSEVLYNYLYLSASSRGYFMDRQAKFKDITLPESDYIMPIIQNANAN